ncbi:AAA domain containing protein [Nitzschia inconspicua]|uniref:AAA domain containing protein n=1 Tax=Nitzschia inconspicua TaxID=303405 RepID=A0A9K3LAC3_9STRA|nr:AAA domain containing protein [Nitzschia inconspicua]
MHEDLEISADEEGCMFYNSSVANYLCSPKESEDVCLYDLLAKYSACRPGTNSLNWGRPHPNKDHLKIKALNDECLPVINHLDCLDTKQFEEHDIFTCNIKTIPPEIHLVMEEHAKRCCVVFANTDLQLHGSFLKRWRKEKEDGKLGRRHIQFLVNVQNCRNSTNGGKSLDMVERLTSKPAKHGCLGEINFEEEEVEDDINEAFDQFLLEGSLEGGFDNEFRNSRGQFNCHSQSILTRCHGSHQCGSNLVICPNVGHGDCLLVVEARERMVSEGNETTVLRPNQDNYLNCQALNELAIKVVRRIVDKNGRVVDIGVNGTLENVRDFADIFFCDDGDQWRSFQIITCAFIDQLYKEAERTEKESSQPQYMDGHHLSPAKRRRFDDIRGKIGKVIDNKQLIGFLCGAGGTGKSHVIKTVCRHAQKLCEELHVKFDKRSIVLMALTGAAPVSINGETTAKAFAFKREVRNELEEFKKAYLVIVDEVSFASDETERPKPWTVAIHPSGQYQRFYNQPIVLVNNNSSDFSHGRYRLLSL